MTRKYKLIGLTAALATAVALPALAAYSLTDPSRRTGEVETEQTSRPHALMLADNDGGHGRSHDRHHSDDDEDDDDDDGGSARSMPAPAPTGEPPANGLFNKGSSKPQVQVN